MTVLFSDPDWLLRVLNLWGVIPAGIGFPFHVALVSSAESTAGFTVNWFPVEPWPTKVPLR
jgi:hypothetical protein